MCPPPFRSVPTTVGTPKKELHRRRDTTSTVSQPSHRLGEAVHMAEQSAQSKGLVELRSRERHLAVGLEHGTEGTTLGPGGPGITLDDAVGLVPPLTGCDQRQQDRLAEDE